MIKCIAFCWMEKEEEEKNIECVCVCVFHKKMKYI